MPEVRRTRILIVDDSAVMRSLLRSVIAADSSLEVAGTAADGAVGADCTRAQPSRPHSSRRRNAGHGWLVTLRRLRELGHKMPVIMCSSLTQRGAKVTIEALAGGASDYVAKPPDQPGRDAAVRILAQELLPKIHALRKPPPRPAAPQLVPRFGMAALTLPASTPLPAASPSVVVIGVSTGGPAALDVLLPALPRRFSTAGPRGAAHARSLHPAVCRAVESALPASRLRGVRR